MRLLIVDDEDLEQEGLRNLISGLGLEIDICGSAFNGSEALDMAQQLQPDVVVTDVRMPVMDGITFARELRRRQSNCFILFISGFEDFQAARVAMGLGASAWLVKPVNHEELYAVLAGICRMADERTRIRREEEQRGRRLERLLPLERQEFLKSLLLPGEAQPQSVVSEQAATLGLQLLPGRFAVMVAEAQDPAALRQRHIGERLAELAQTLRYSDALEPVLLPGSRLAFIFAFAEISGEEIMLNRLEAVAEKLLMEASLACKSGVGVGVSLIGGSAAGLAELYRQACAALEEKSQYGLGRVIFFSGNPAAAGADRQDQIVRLVRTLVHSEIGADLSAEAVAARVYLTASHLRRVFKNRTGMTLQDYVLRTRMEHAQELLRAPVNRVHTVAAKVGYESTSYFCLVFKKFFGITPGEFRSRLNYPS